MPMSRFCLPRCLSLIIISLLAGSLAAIIPNNGVFTLQSKSNSDIEIHFVLPDFQQESINQDGQVRTKITIEGAGYTSEQGEAELPIFSTMVAIADHGDFQLLPLQMDSKILKDVHPALYYDDEQLLTKNLFEINGLNTSAHPAIKMSSPQIMRDFRVLIIQINPFQYDENSSTLRVYQDIHFKIQPTGKPGINEFNSQRRISSIFDPIYRSQILNYDQLSNRNVETLSPRILVIYGDSNDPVLGTLIKDYALWKRQKGAEVDVFSTASTGSSNSSIKTFLQGRYNNLDTRPDFVVLIGDMTGSFAIPAWNIDGYGDYPYQMLAGNDQLGDVVLGRISAESSYQLGVIMSKIYAYEKNINPANAHHLNRLLLVADTLYSGSSVVNLNSYIKALSLATNPNYTHTMLSQNSPNPNQVASAFNQGVSIFNYRGYAGLSGFSVNENNISNINKLSHTIIITCNTGNFDATSTTEQFIRLGTSSVPKGAITSIGMYGPETATMPNNALCGGIFFGIYALGMRTMGEALLYSKLNFSRLYSQSNPSMTETFNHWCHLMGDPTVEVFVTIPETFNVSMPTSIPLGIDRLDFEVLDEHDKPVKNACVTISHENNGDPIIISKAYTDAFGRALLPFSDLPEISSLIVTISKHDFKPLQKVLMSESGTLLAGAPMIDDDNQGASQGNGNQMANAGESLEILFALRNTSTNDIINPTGTIQLQSQYASLENSSISFPSIMAESSSFCTEPIILQISAQTPNNTLLRFTLELTDEDGNSYVVSDHITVTDALFRFESSAVLDPENNVLDPGETRSLNITIQNIGSLDISDLMAELYTGNDLVSVVDSLGSFGYVQTGQQASTSTDNFVLQARNELIAGMVIPFKLRLFNDAGFMQWLDFSLSVGSVQQHDPLGPDKFGYLIYDDTDTEYDQCPVYDWIEIAPEEGGLGMALPVSDPDAPTEGDDLGSSSVAVVNLPFAFPFYAKEYQQITVCTNGFIAMGITDNAEFRNYRLPGPMGPSPMIAAFWDDLATSNNSKIYTWFDEENHLFVIQWYKMLNGYLNDYEETFQVILYDPAFHPNSLGQGNIKIQYHTFNNVDSGASYQSHGNFCTIGIKSPDQLDGLEYSYNNQYPTAAAPLGNGRAIFITTVPVYYDNPWLVIDETVLNDQNNGIAEAGENIDLGVILKNLGNRTANDITALLSSSDPYVSIGNHSSAYPSINANSFAVNLLPFSLQIAPNTPANHIITFTLELHTFAASWTHTFSIEVKQKSLILEKTFFNDFSTNNNGLAEPGETALLILNVKNPTSIPCVELEATLSSNDAHITIHNPVINSNQIEAFSIQQFVYEITIDPNLPLYSTIEFNIVITSQAVSILTQDIALACGEMGLNEDFEQSEGDFASQEGWEWGISSHTPAHSGSKIWATSLDDNYPNGASFSLVSPIIKVINNATLSFWHRLGCQPNFDGGNVSISTNNGNSWTVINPASGGTYANSIYSMNEPGFTGNIPTWTKVVFNLNAYAGQSIQIRWHFTSDGSINGLGWFIDDVSVSGYATKTGKIEGSLLLSNEADLPSATLSVDTLKELIVNYPSASGDYSFFLPFGTYKVKSHAPYYVNDVSPSFVIEAGAWAHQHDFNLIALPPVLDFTLDYQEVDELLNLVWMPPLDPPYEIHEYRIYKKTYPGRFEMIAQTQDTQFIESLSQNGIYSYYVCPFYGADEGRPSEVLNLEISDPTAIDDDAALVRIPKLLQNYPNPFNPSTTIAFELPQTSSIKLRIFNLKGQLVKTLYSGLLPAGAHQIIWNGLNNHHKPVASGMYLYRLETAGKSQTKKMLLLK